MHGVGQEGQDDHFSQVGIPWKDVLCGQDTITGISYKSCNQTLKCQNGATWEMNIRLLS